jgi:hypothetical protein
MSFEVALVVASVILLTTVAVMTALIARRHQQAKEEELKREASARGWTFERKQEGGYRVHRWTGSTGGIAWQAESLWRASSKHQERRLIARWHGTWRPGINGAVLVIALPKGKQDLGTGIAAGDGFFARLAQKAAGFALDKSLDLYFGEGPGKEVDAATMQRVDNSRIPGFVVMAADKGEGARMLADGLEHALGALQVKNTWILYRPSGLSLAKKERFKDANEIDSFIQAGLTLTRSNKFARPDSTFSRA